MALTICLIKEDGTIVDSVADLNLLGKYLPNKLDPRFYCLKYIDLYGDTVFNILQMDDVLNEIYLAQKEVKDSNVLMILNKMKEFAIKCKEGTHLYIKILGD